MNPHIVIMRRALAIPLKELVIPPRSSLSHQSPITPVSHLSAGVQYNDRPPQLHTLHTLQALEHTNIKAHYKHTS